MLVEDVWETFATLVNLKIFWLSRQAVCQYLVLLKLLKISQKIDLSTNIHSALVIPEKQMEIFYKGKKKIELLLIKNKTKM